MTHSGHPDVAHTLVLLSRHRIIVTFANLAYAGYADRNRDPVTSCEMRDQSVDTEKRIAMMNDRDDPEKKST
jgi:hypothetical protein